ncbi:hypothetical protein NE619_15725 [Anaerovorax odorimutans]|uniref:Uncharacterized protein n=1 Tax=Anaerovorax odorimutans TaxID=109327 RepID=A0ABT1RSQ7_9FIRM|nr:hypothetical protein [Anaerovorax odorimutans]MCQ4638184.1 hypothetical protein [Anaerovorax odorimutans]
MWVCRFYGFILGKISLEIDQQGRETLKKDPLLSLFLDESSGNALVRYYTKLNRRFFLLERSPGTAQSIEQRMVLEICDQIPILPANPATIVPKEAPWSQAI